jgi:hypothetical protein
VIPPKGATPVRFVGPAEATKAEIYLGEAVF